MVCDSNEDARCAQNPQNIESTCNSTNSKCYTRTVGNYDNNIDLIKMKYVHLNIQVKTVFTEIWFSDGRILRDCDNLDAHICNIDTNCSICVNLGEVGICNNVVSFYIFQNLFKRFT